MNTVKIFSLVLEIDRFLNNLYGCRTRATTVYVYCNQRIPCNFYVDIQVSLKTKKRMFHAHMYLSISQCDP